MTIWELSTVLRRRWPVLAAGLACTLLAAFLIIRVPGVYYAQVNVLFMPPQLSEDQNTFQNSAGGAIAAAGIVSRVLNGESGDQGAVSDQVTLVGEGVREGTSIRLPNAGGQWAYNFNKPLLNVEAAGPAQADVEASIQREVARISTELARQQAEMGVSADQLIIPRLSPPVPIIRHQRGSSVRSLGAALMLGLGLSVAVAVTTDRVRLGARRRRRSLVTIPNVPEPVA